MIAAVPAPAALASLPISGGVSRISSPLRAVTMQLCAPLGSAATWTREESARMASEWLIMRSGFKNALLIIGTTGSEIDVELDLIAFFAAEGGAAIASSAPIRNPGSIRAIGIDAYCLPAQSTRPFSVVSAPVRYQVPILFGGELVVPDQRIGIAQLQSQCVRVSSRISRSDCA